VVDEVVPDLAIDFWVLDRGVGEDQGGGVGPILGIGGGAGDQAAVGLLEAGIKRLAGAAVEQEPGAGQREGDAKAAARELGLGSLPAVSLPSDWLWQPV